MRAAPGIATPGPSEEAWIRAFIAEAEGGHAARTMELAEAVRNGKPSRATHPALGKVDVKALRASLEQESSAAARNRLMRFWLAKNLDDIVAAWTALGFPPPPRGGPAPSGPQSAARPVPPLLATPSVVSSHGRDPAPRPALPNLRSLAPRRGDIPGVIMFDFDMTLSTRNVGTFEDLSQIDKRGFGGPARLEMLREMLSDVRSRGILMGVVSRNSRHLICKVLKQVGLYELFDAELFFGFEDYADEVHKSAVISDLVLAPLGLQGSCMLFVDDDSANIRDVRERCSDVQVLQAPRCGIGEEECMKIVAWANSLRD